MHIETIQTRTSQRADAQTRKVCMFQTLKGVLGIGQEAKAMKIFGQNSRILSEFPWLWSLRHEWKLSSVVIKVLRTDFPPFLSQKVSEENDISGVWIHCWNELNGSVVESVTTVWNVEVQEKPIERICREKWNHAITLQSRFLLVPILHIAIISRDGNTVTVFEPKTMDCFNNVVHYPD